MEDQSEGELKMDNDRFIITYETRTIHGAWKTVESQPLDKAQWDTVVEFINTNGGMRLISSRKA